MIFGDRHILSSLFFFFFSSRRRHTRCSRDWSSDVCSSDLLFRHAWRVPFCTTTSPPFKCRVSASSSSSQISPSCATHPTASPGLDRKMRSEEHTSELQSRLHLVCRLLLEKKKKKKIRIT